jgi:hypothetical protein
MLVIEIAAGVALGGFVLIMVCAAADSYMQG